MPDLFERQMLRVRNGLAYLTGANRPTVAQSPRDLVWSGNATRPGCGGTAPNSGATGRRC